MLYIYICVYIYFFLITSTILGSQTFLSQGQRALFSSTCLVAMEYGLIASTYLASVILDKDKLEFTSPIMS